MRSIGSTPQKNEPLQFSKMAGGGNDFVVIDHRSQRVADPGDLTRRICTRRLSVGADGLILIETSARATFRMRYFNSDGGASEFCGNGTRCAARFAFLNVIAPRRMTIETDAGIVTAEVGDKGEVTITMPQPQAFRHAVRVDVGQASVQGTALLVGVPHFVVPVDGDLWSRDIVPLGRAIRHHQVLQPQGANVNFVSFRDSHSIEVRTYERGVEDETLSCGSGVVSSAVVSGMYGKVQSPVSVLTRSGITLEVSFDLVDGEPQNVRLKGDARLIYRAALTAETIDGFDAEFVRDPTARVEVP